MDTELIEYPKWHARNGMLVGAFALILGVVGVIYGGTPGLIAGILAILVGLLVGGLGLSTYRDPHILQLTPEGIIPRTRVLLPWEDLEDVALMSAPRETEVRRRRRWWIDGHVKYSAASDQRLGPRGTLEWPVPNKKFGTAVLQQVLDYAARVGWRPGS